MSGGRGGGNVRSVRDGWSVLRGALEARRRAGNPLLAYLEAARDGRLPSAHLPFSRDVRSALEPWFERGAPNALWVEAIVREVVTPRFAWAVPSDEALARLARLGPIVEVGAGTGYWAALLRERGVDVLATDARPYVNLHCGMRWTSVRRAPAHEAAREATRALLLCWPPLGFMALDALDAFGGEQVVVVGDVAREATANAAFYAALDARTFLEDRVALPSWRGVPATLEVRRIGKRRPEDITARRGGLS